MQWFVVLGCLVCGFSYAHASGVDNSFMPCLPDNHFVTAVFEQEDGSLLVGGFQSPDLGGFLMRLHKDGQVDRSFRVHWKGRVVPEGPTAILVRPDRQIGVLGWSDLYELITEPHGRLNWGGADLSF